MNDNLIKAEDLTSTELRERARKGGIASGKARRKKKATKEIAKTILAMSLEAGEPVDIDTIKSIADLNNQNITAEEAIIFQQVTLAISGDLPAAKFILELSGKELKAPNKLENEEQKARIAKLKAETERIKGEENAEQQNDGFIEALQNEVADVWEE